MRSRERERRRRCAEPGAVEGHGEKDGVIGLVVSLPHRSLWLLLCPIEAGSESAGRRRDGRGAAMRTLDVSLE